MSYHLWKGSEELSILEKCDLTPINKSRNQYWQCSMITKQLRHTMKCIPRNDNTGVVEHQNRPKAITVMKAI